MVGASQTAAVDCLPQLRRSVELSRGEPLPVGAECDGLDRAGRIHRLRPALQQRLRIPELHRAVLAHRDQQFVAGADSDAPDGGVVARQLP